MTPTLIDTDVLSLLMRNDPSVTLHARQYLMEHGQLTFSIITRYEVLKGLAAKNAAKQMAAFHVFCASSRIIPIDDEIIRRGAEVYADLRQRGITISDADILIAATATVQQLSLATRNISHFSSIPTVNIVTW